MDTKRTIKLSHEEIELIQKALSFAYAANMELSKNTTISDKAGIELINTANKYGELESNISSGSKDI